MSYTIIESDITNNKKDIIAILSRNLPGQSEERYSWNYEKCLYGKTRCWLAKEDKTNTFIGSGTLFPRKILINGEPVFTAIAGDFAIDKAHRGLGPALKLQKNIQESFKKSGFKFIYGVPNELSAPLFLKIGYKEIGTFNRFVKILRAEYKTKQYLPFRLFSKVIDLIIKFHSKENRYKKTLNYMIETPGSFDEKFDRLWSKVSKQFNVIGERTSDFLRWRYCQSPTWDYKIFCLIDEKKEILGYIVYFVKDNMCRVVDVLFTGSEVLNALLAEFLLFARKNNFGSISVYYLGSSKIEQKLREFNFFIRENEDSVIIYNSDTSLEPILLNKENWHFFAGDNDV